MTFLYGNQQNRVSLNGRVPGVKAGRDGIQSVFAMSLNELGGAFDIHAGGIDLIFPHHENEIAQARCGENVEFAHYWMHNEFVNLKDKKMAKSEGNVVLVHELTEKFSTEAIRLFFLQSHYRKSIAFEEQLIKNAESAVERLGRIMQIADTAIESRVDDTFVKEYKEAQSKPVLSYLSHVIKAMNDDFNTPMAIGEMFKLADEMNNKIEKDITDSEFVTVWQGRKLLQDLNSIVRIIPEKSDNIASEVIEKLVNKRNQYRAERNWDEADQIRNQLFDMGVVVEDKKDGTNGGGRGNRLKMFEKNIGHFKIKILNLCFFRKKHLNHAFLALQ